MPPKKTINRPEVRRISWENLRGGCKDNLFEQIAFDPIANDMEPSECREAMYGPLIPTKDLEHKRPEFYRYWIGARIEQGRLDEADLYYLTSELNEVNAPQPRALFLLPKNTRMRKMVEGTIPAAIRELVAAAGDVTVIGQLRMLSLNIADETPNDQSLDELAALLVPVTEDICVQRWGQYFAVILTLAPNA